jgi:hypothetical protein
MQLTFVKIARREQKFGWTDEVKTGAIIQFNNIVKLYNKNPSVTNTFTAFSFVFASIIN